jgi:hypothetical protein
LIFFPPPEARLIAGGTPLPLSLTAEELYGAGLSDVGIDAFAQS